MLRLPPAVHPTIQELLSEKEMLMQWVSAFGSPLNVVFPDQTKGSIDSFASVLRQHGVDYEMRCAHKPTQSHALISAVESTGVGLDVASLGELRHALGAGFRGERLVATGPKTRAFVKLAIQHNVVLSVDSWDELESIAHGAALRAESVRVLVRLHGFAASHTAVHSKDTRFGIHVREIPGLISYFLRTKQIRLLGYAFHLNAATAEEKRIAIEQSILALRDTIAAGLQPYILNIGGGFHVTMVEDREAWDRYETALRDSVRDGNAHLSWDKSGLGYRTTQGVVGGAPSFHNHAPDRTGAQELHALLLQTLPAFHGQTVASVLRDMLLTLWIEPGHAVYDQAGITIASVLSVKRSAHGERVVVLNMNRSNLNTIDLAHMADPVLVHRDGEREEGEGVFFAGNLCLASDMITRHKVFLPILPRVGDLVVFVNTAAYRMHFAQSNTLLQPIAATIAVTRRAQKWEWCMDEQWPNESQAYGV